MNALNDASFEIAEALLAWYRKNKRELPFRRQRDPYSVWISEVMSQQTRMENVVPYYLHFMERFPDMESLARADEDVLLKAWQGLGYYSRARNLQKSARICMEQYGGRLPQTKNELQNLPGIGDYTAGAIASICFDEKVSAIDGNVIRVMSRLFMLGQDFSKAKNKKELDSLIVDLMRDPADFNQALMEFGALVCRPRDPDCEVCVLSRYCMAARKGCIKDYPVKKKAIKRIPEQKEFYWHVFRQDEKPFIRLVKRDQGLLSGLYGPDETENPSALKKIELQAYEHQFTHKIWKVIPYIIFVREMDETFISYEDLDRYSIPAAFRPMLEQLDHYLKEGKIHETQIRLF